MERVRWTEQQAAAVAALVAERQTKRGESFVRALEAAVDELKIPSRKAMAAAALGQRFEIPYRKALRELNASYAQKDAPAKAMLIQQAPHPFDALIDEVARQLAESIAERLRNVLRERVREAAQGLAPVASVAAQQRKRSILVVGTREDQAAMLRKEFSELLDLTCWTTEDGLAKPVQGSYHTIVLWADFINHAVSSRVLEGFGAERVRVVRGGMTHLRETLEEVFCA